jgi:hypothetical protein
MGFSVSFTGCGKRSKECWNETHTISASAPAAKTKKKPAGVSQGEHEQPTAIRSRQGRYAHSGEGDHAVRRMATT